MTKKPVKIKALKQNLHKGKGGSESRKGENNRLYRSSSPFSHLFSPFLLNGFFEDVRYINLFNFFKGTVMCTGDGKRSKRDLL